jgi:hypothetical protein
MRAARFCTSAEEDDEDNGGIDGPYTAPLSFSSSLPEALTSWCDADGDKADDAWDETDAGKGA